MSHGRDLGHAEADMGKNRAPAERAGGLNRKRELRVQIKRIYDSRMRGDGLRILVDRLWPRGVRKDEAHLYRWAKELAPSTELRRWFNHEPKRWQQFGRRYQKELSQRTAQLEALRNLARRRPITLLYAARNRDENEAVILKRALESR
jgi:uncharacterized protein YeaO (DUF488 family)